MEKFETKNKKYTQLLNNLLVIKARDQALFTKINNLDSFDINSKFGRQITKRILSQKDFKVGLEELDLQYLLEVTTQAKTAVEIIDAFANKKEKLSQMKQKALQKELSFEFIKKELIEDLTTKIEKSRNRWALFRRKTIDANTQENIWQLHVATGFISVKTSTREIYAPLLLREVMILVNDKDFKLVSTSPWKINEKVFFMLNEAGFKLNPDLDFENQTGWECLQLIKELFGSEIVVHFDDPFEQLNVEQIKNKEVAFHPGLVLGMFKPSGGNLRKMMLEIIANKEIDEVLNPAPDKRSYETLVQDFIKNKSDTLLRIQKSNFSQDKALISALLQDSIIWGPPGTGKSQVIANIIANLLYNYQTAVVMSQKKAALDVLKKRLGKIAPFVLFILNDNKMDKVEFYKPLKEFVAAVEYSFPILENKKEKMISEQEIQILRNINQAKINQSYEPSLHLLENFQANQELLRKVFQLSSQYQYPKLNNGLLSYKNYQVIFANHNRVQKDRRFFFKSYPRDFMKSAKNSYALFADDLNFNLNQALTWTQKTSFQTVENLLVAPQGLRNKNPEYHSDEQYLYEYLSSKILEKIKFWETVDQDKLASYKRFANAVRAGRRIPYKFMNDHEEIIKELFPVVVTTPETSFIKWEKQAFDYAILDESSQMFIEIGLPVLYIAKTRILAGDPQQMQPTSWFVSRYEVDENDEDVAENAASVLNYALDKGVYQIMLDQNFRSSSAALMSFSSKQFYESRLEVIDQNQGIENLNQPKIEVKNVRGKWEDSVNKTEVREVLKTIKEQIKHYQSIIVLTFNVYQRQLIEKEIIEKHPDLLLLIEEEKLIIRNLENVQGDEADLVIMSVVYDETTNMASTYVARPGGKNALNVAISRAREKMIVIKSVNHKKINSANTSDFFVFRQWLEFLDLDEAAKRSYSLLENQEVNQIPVSVNQAFKDEILDALKKDFLISKEIEIVPNYLVGSQMIDLAILDSHKNFKFGIWLDDYPYQTQNLVENYLVDLSKQNFLEYKGYPIYRIKEIDWKTQKNHFLTQLEDLINQ